jgi:putative transcriptional regulator
MISTYVIELIAKRIAGDIAISADYGAALRRWREIFGVTQQELARVMGISASVISDYEKSRRAPGVRFLKKFVEALILVDSRRDWEIVKQLARSLNLNIGAIIDSRELSSPMLLHELLECIKGAVINSVIRDSEIYGYTVLDSIGAIETMSGNEFWQIMGMTSRRALIFTKVTTGRSPLIAVRVAPVKPAVIVLHGLRKADPLAIRLADREGIPLLISLADNVEELVKSLRSKTSHYL